MDHSQGPIDSRIDVGRGVSLRVLRWTPGDGTEHEPGPAFLLVHGLASNARLWDGVGRQLAEAGHEAVAVDLRGHGQSSKPDDGYDFATIAEDLAALVGQLGLEHLVAAGQSWGANVVLDLAVRRPDLVSCVVAVDGGVADMQDALPTWDETWARLAPPQLVGTPLTRIQGYFRGAHGEWPEEGIAGSLANFEVRPDGTVAPWLTRERHRAILRELWGQRPSELWASLRVPAVLVMADTGDSGWTAGKRAAAERAAAAMAANAIPHEVHWLVADHDVHAQHPAEVTGILLAAAAGLARAGGGAAASRSDAA